MGDKYTYYNLPEHMCRLVKEHTEKPCALRASTHHTFGALPTPVFVSRFSPLVMIAKMHSLVHGPL